MRILHLAYEDPRQPGSGGGSVRTREVNRRLAERHEVTCVVAAYPGARERVEDGIRWVPVGPRRAGLLPRLAWFGLMPFSVRAHRSDLVVEDFGAPFSTGLSPLYTRRPVVAVVQWMFAREMRAKYHLPFDVVERYGVRAYDDLITVSDWLARDVVARNPRAIVEAIPNGLGAEAFAVPDAAAPEHFAFLGRLDIGHKGLDLLVDAVAEGLRRTGGGLPPVLVIGEGPDRAALERLVQERGLAGRIRLVGRVEGAAKTALLARSHAVLMPSRYETFGIVAVEAQAAGVPLVTFDVGPLREVTGGHGTALVPPLDTQRFVDEMLAVLDDPRRRVEAATTGREWSRRYDWDVIAAAQERHYEAALERHRRRLLDGREPGPERRR
jgi:glycosyltransferase involved in cell wall biosynthesis